ncbi:hypothetical protein EV426DRAFT_681750 [Tirmania nivea]|nr:hypothetical protein EV426DRAFT_681750 [Tirmania nivea]
MPSRLSHTPHTKLPKPKTSSINRNPQRPQAGATNSYTTPLSKHLGWNIVPASPKDPSKRGRYGQTPAKPGHRPPNLRGVAPPPTADSTSQPVSGFEPPRMAELREQYNQTPSPERLSFRPAVVRFAATADYMSPLESKQQHQRQQQRLRSRIPVQGTATDSLSPRKLFGSRDNAKSQPLIQSYQRRREVTTSRDVSRGKEEANSSPLMTSKEALTPMYFTMQYQKKRSQMILGTNYDIPLQGLGLAAVHNHDIHDGYKRKVSLRFERPEENVVETETGYAQVDEPGRNKPMQDEDWTDLVAQQAHQGHTATSLEEKYTYPRCVESEYNPQATTKLPIALPAKQASKSLGYLRNLNIRNLSLGNNIPKDVYKKEVGATTQAAEKPEEKRNSMKRTSTVLDRVRKFEALGYGMLKEVQQPTSTHPPLASSGVDLIDGKPSGPVLKKWYTNSRSNLRQYFHGKGKEPSYEDITAPNPPVHAPREPSTTQRRQSCAATEQLSIYNSNTSFKNVHRRVSETAENLKLSVSKNYQKSNLEKTYKYQNPDGGRFPPWPNNNAIEVARESPVKMGGSSMIDARRRKSDVSFLPLPSDARPGQQFIDVSLRSDAPERVGSHVNGITPNLEPSEWRCSMAYWAGRYSTVRDTMRQEILAMEDPAESEMVCLDDWHRDFVEAVFQRLFESAKEHLSTSNGVGYSEKQVAYLREYQKDTMKIVAIKTRKRVDAESINQTKVRSAMNINMIAVKFASVWPEIRRNVHTRQFGCGGNGKRAREI